MHNCNVTKFGNLCIFLTHFSKTKICLKSKTLTKSVYFGTQFRLELGGQPNRCWRLSKCQTYLDKSLPLKTKGKTQTARCSVSMEIERLLLNCKKAKYYACLTAICTSFKHSSHEFQTWLTLNCTVWPREVVPRLRIHMTPFNLWGFFWLSYSTGQKTNKFIHSLLLLSDL